MQILAKYILEGPMKINQFPVKNPHFRQEMLSQMEQCLTVETDEHPCLNLSCISNFKCFNGYSMRMTCTFCEVSQNLWRYQHFTAQHLTYRYVIS